MKLLDRIMGRQNVDETTLREAISSAASDFSNARYEADKKTIDYRMKIADDKDRARRELSAQEDDEKRKQGLQAVYALNLCMVSLSQIVDYADINVLKQEYDSILNNLNLEVMPKDEALLSALKQILDTCHFYILHQKDKELLTKKQELRLSNALGNAVSGGVFAIFSTPNPWAIAVSAATMIGVAAVRYKTERRKAMLENEIEAWELEKTALEQLHNLRRTLFETAWRLSKEYGFADSLRLTESQIKNYNEILTDPDPQSRYERLSLIKNDFEAYPLFWYYLGRAAMEAAELFLPSDERQKRLGCGEDVNVDVVGAFLNVEARALTNDVESHGKAMSFYSLYREEAKNAFDKFKHFDDDSEAEVKLTNLLREDVVSASAWLDASDFCKTCKDELEHIERAYALAGTNAELLQTCAFRYLKLLHDATADDDSLTENGIKICVVHAEDCLRKLISADVRPDLNGRALGALYKKSYDLFHGAFTIDFANDESLEFNPRNRYLRMKAALSSKHAFVPMWLRPWDGPELATEWGRYLNGDGLKRSLACFLDGRMRTLLKKFYAALESDLTNGSWKGLATLKSDWGDDDPVAKVITKNDKPEIELKNKSFEEVHMRFWYDGSEYKSSLLSDAYKNQMQLIVRNPLGAATHAVLDGATCGAYSAYRMCRYIKERIDKSKERQMEIKVSLEDLVDFEVASAIKDLLEHTKKADAFADCARESFRECFEREATLYNRIANFVYKSESGWIWKDNPEIPVSQYDDEIDLIEEALRKFIVAASGMVADIIISELEFDAHAGEKNEQSAEKTATTYFCAERMPKNISIPLCVAFVQSIEKKVEDSRCNIARSRMGGKFTFPAYWSSLPGGVGALKS
ncbi:MAG: hypothetical protein IJH50_12710 [Kiritimatiellae bacterium]|nr:hypothetical protein [Kiritimatiellia bacterium]